MTWKRTTTRGLVKQQNTFVESWCSGYQYWTTSFNKAWTKVLRRFQSWPQCDGDSRWWGSATMVPAENKAKGFLLVNHTTKTIHHHNNNNHHHHHHHHHHHKKWRKERIGTLIQLKRIYSLRNWNNPSEN